jgi:hypothetical protein
MEESFQGAIELVEGECGDAQEVAADGYRYLTITPAPGMEPVALRLRGYCDDPRVACMEGYVQADGTVDSSANPAPVYQLPSEWGAPETPGTISVRDTEIVEYAVYTVQSKLENDELFSMPNAANTLRWGDTNQSGWCADVDDILCMVAAFAGTFEGGCTPRSADMEPACGQPDGDIDVDDLMALVEAYAAIPYPCPDACGTGSPLGPCSGEAPEGPSAPEAPEGPSGPEGPEGPMGPGGSGPATINLTASPTSIKPNQTVSVQAFLTSGTTTRAFQVAVQVSGGTSGSLVLETVTINDTQTNYLFYGLNDLPATDVAGARLAATLFSGSVPAALQKYMGTFTFRASPDANGTFIVTLRPAETLLRDANYAPVSWEAGLSATVVVQGD